MCDLGNIQDYDGCGKDYSNLLLILPCSADDNWVLLCYRTQPLRKKAKEREKENTRSGQTLGSASGRAGKFRPWKRRAGFRLPW